jgi:oxygen-dependent protoporphyrinogen oxidase
VLHPTVAVVGGGLTGLVAAHRLRKLLPTAQLTIYEKDDRLGGKIRTVQTPDGIVDAGADSIVTSKPAARRLCEELGIADRLEPMASADLSVQRDGVFRAVPLGRGGVVPEDLQALARSGLVSPDAVRRLTEEPHLPSSPPTSGDESVAAFLRRRFGEEYARHVAEPVLAALQIADPERLSVRAAFPQLCRLEQAHGSLITGAAAIRADAGTQTTGLKVSFPQGMGALIDALVRPPRRIRHTHRTSVRSITRPSGRYLLTAADGQTHQADAIVLTTPAHVNSSLLERLDKELAQAHSDFPYSSVVNIVLFFQEEDVPDLPPGVGYLNPEARTDVAGCMVPSRIWRGRAREGLVQVKVFLGRPDRDVTSRSDAELLRIADEEIQRTIKPLSAPVRRMVFRWPLALPQYTLGHLERVAALEELVSLHPRLHLAGAAYHGLGIPDCVTSAEQAAQECAEALT